MPVPKIALPASGAVTAEQVAPLLRFLQEHPLLDGAFVDVTHDGVSTNIDVNHGLGRAYRGALQVGASESDPLVVCLLPNTAKASGVDVTKKARFRQPTLDAMTTRWWVF
jgi:hypothetical protein